MGILLLFRRGGVGGTIASLNAREPNPADIKELQLVDAVQEMFHVACCLTLLRH